MSVSRWLGLVWLVVFAVAANVLVTPSADASHRQTSGTRSHQTNMHTDTGGRGALDEEYCVDSHTSYISNATARTKVYTALFNYYPRWDNIKMGSTSTADTRVDIWELSGYCRSYSQAARDAIEVEIHISKVNADVSNKWCPENLSCVSHFTAIWNSTAGHSDYRWEWIFLDYDNISNSTNSDRTVNHEMGHVFGLRDGDGTCVPQSLMHNIWYGCSYSGITPTQGDLDSLRAAASGR